MSLQVDGKEALQIKHPSLLPQGGNEGGENKKA